MVLTQRQLSLIGLKLFQHMSLWRIVFGLIIHRFGGNAPNRKRKFRIGSNSCVRGESRRHASNWNNTARRSTRIVFNVAILTLIALINRARRRHANCINSNLLLGYDARHIACLYRKHAILHLQFQKLFTENRRNKDTGFI